MNLEDIRGFTLKNVAKTNVILGKNGCGKSFLLKQLEQGLKGDRGKIRYVSPERGGILQYESNVDQQMSQNDSYIDESRRQNQSSNFRSQSATLFRRLELLVLREIERDHTQAGYKPFTF